MTWSLVRSPCASSRFFSPALSPILLRVGFRELPSNHVGSATRAQSTNRKRSDLCTRQASTGDWLSRSVSRDNLIPLASTPRLQFTPLHLKNGCANTPETALTKDCFPEYLLFATTPIQLRSHSGSSHRNAIFSESRSKWNRNCTSKHGRPQHGPGSPRLPVQALCMLFSSFVEFCAGTQLTQARPTQT